MTSASLFRQLTGALDNAGILYMVVGSFASNLYGTGRGTQDIDIVISADAGQVRALLGAFPESKYYFDVQDALEACRRKSMFNILDMEGGWKIDIIFQKPGAFHRQALLRRVPSQIDGINVFALTAEDVIISKLDWAKMGQSSRQIEDVAGVLQVQKDRLDLPYIEKWIDELGLGEPWSQARKLADTG